MAGTRRGASAGAEYAFIGFYDSAGNPTGGTATAPANGTVSDFDNILGIKSVPSTTPEPDTVPSTGDDTLIADFDFDSIATRRYTATVAAFDLDMIGQMQGTSVVALGDGLFGVEDVVGANIPDSCIIVQARTKKQDVATKGKKAWSGFIEPLCSTRYLGRDAYTERAAAVYNLSITPQAASQTPWGVTLQSQFNISGARRIPFSTDNPLAFATAYGNNSLAAWPVRHRPISAAKCFAYIIPAGYTTGGILATVSSVSTTAPYSITIGTVAPAGAKVQLYYEFDLFVDF